MPRRSRDRNRTSRPYRPSPGSPLSSSLSVSTRSCGRRAFSTKAATRLSIFPCSCSEAKSSTRIAGLSAKRNTVSEVGTCWLISASVAVSIWNAGAVAADVDCRVRHGGRWRMRQRSKQPERRRSRQHDATTSTASDRAARLRRDGWQDADRLVGARLRRPHASAAGAAWLRRRG